MEDDLLQFFKAMADENRLKIIGLLARESYSGEVLAEILGVKPATVSHHLAKLAEAGLVSARMEGHAKLYSLRLDALHAMAGRLLAPGTLPAAAAPDPSARPGQALDAFDGKVLADFTRPDGTLKQIPVQQKKLQAVLRHLVKEFEPGQRYPEKQVNARLGRYHADTASLRRALIEYRLMQRAGGVYWRMEKKVEDERTN
ncbi:MAG: metalloregulator ArsR/SmtB family transcription factor [Anaerolineales bacterium]